MAVDEKLNERVRQVLGERAGLSEKRMFGGVCFLLNGNMLCCASRERMMFRVGKDQDAAALKRPGASAMEMSGRRMAGFVFVDTAHCDARGLKTWIALAESYVGTLPAKKTKRGRAPVM
jgi:TfoX/Sxy family transcriptional regulator of competence genes